MKRNFLFAKIHQARVTHADLEYEGSFAIDDEILELSTIQPNEQIHVYNIEQCTALHNVCNPCKTRLKNHGCEWCVRPFSDTG